LPTEVETQLPDCGVAHWVRIDHLSRLCKSSHNGFLYENSTTRLLTSGEEDFKRMSVLKEDNFTR